MLLAFGEQKVYTKDLGNIQTQFKKNKVVWDDVMWNTFVSGWWPPNDVPL